MNCPSCNKPVSGVSGKGPYQCSGCGARIRANPLKDDQYAPHGFVLGDSAQGYAVRRLYSADRDTQTGWETQVWNEGFLWRTDDHKNLYQALEYITERAYSMYEKAWVKKHAGQFKRVTGYDLDEINVRHGFMRAFTEGENTVRARHIAQSA